jgi:CHAD domain-containing protein
MLYLAQETSPIFHTPSTEFVVRLDRLQHSLGDQHDHVIVATWLRDVADEDPSLRTLATELASRERQRAKKPRRWIKRWKQVAEVQKHQTWR